MGNRRIGRKRLESVMKQVNASPPDTAGSRAGQAAGVGIPAFELQPAKYYGFFDDFLQGRGNVAVAQDEDLAQATAINYGVWRTNVDATSDTIKLNNASTGGILEILHGTGDDEETHMTAINHGFTFDASDARKIWLTCRIKTSDISGTGFFIGLASAAGAEETDSNDLEDSCGFYIVDGNASTALKLLSSVGDSETSTDLDTAVADGTWLTLSFYFDGTSVDAYVNGTKKATSVSANLPADGTIIFPAIHAAAREGAANTISVDYIRVVQER